jgi:hypothetical protein
VDAAVRIVIEDADGVLRVTADRPVRVLLIRYDDLLADPQPENLEVSVAPRRVRRLYRDPGTATEE